MYYANKFYYYKIIEGEKIYFYYTSNWLHKSRKEAENNANKEWLMLAGDNDILEESKVKYMTLWTE